MEGSDSKLTCEDRMTQNFVRNVMKREAVDGGICVVSRKAMHRGCRVDGQWSERQDGGLAPALTLHVLDQQHVICAARQVLESDRRSTEHDPCLTSALKDARVDQGRSSCPQTMSIMAGASRTGLRPMDRTRLPDRPVKQVPKCRLESCTGFSCGLSLCTTTSSL